MREVIVAGNVGVDTNVYLPREFTPESLREREGNFTTNIDNVGQAGGYASLGYARLGRRVGFVGSVGDDPLGRWVEATLRDAGVECELFLDPAGTARSVNLMRPDGTRNNFYDGKSHLTIRPDLDACRRFMAANALAMASSSLDSTVEQNSTSAPRMKSSRYGSRTSRTS